jgi:hypothetical protein
MLPRRVHTKTLIDIATGRVEQGEWYLYDGLWLRAGAMAAWDQDSYAFYDDGTESGSTQVGTTNTETALDVNTNYQCRLLIQETGGADGSINTPEFEFNHNSGGWINVTGSSSPVQAVDSTNLTGGGDTTQRLGAGSFISTNGWVSEDGAMPTLGFLSGEECEGLLSFQIIGSAVFHGDEILLRMFNMDSYTREADIDVNKPVTRRVMVVS